MKFYKLTVDKIVRETADTKTFFLHVPDNLTEAFQFVAGQYLTVKVNLEGEEVRRAYSICSGTESGEIAITVKKVKKGRMSSHLHKKVEKGQEIEVSTPEGHFTVIPDPERTKDHYLIAAGSGITPVMSMIKSILEGEPRSTCYLLYGSRNEEEIIFKHELDSLSKKYEGQLHVTHTLSQPLKKKAEGIRGILGKSIVDWKGEKGRITNHKVREFVSKHPNKFKDPVFYLCGPGNMIEVAETALDGMGVDKNMIRKEYFSVTTDTVSTGTDAEIVITLDKKSHIIEVRADETILEAALRVKLDAPYSCTSGACSSCLARKIYGEIEMDACYALEEEEIKQGFILTCQSRIKSEKAEITYDI